MSLLPLFWDWDRPGPVGGGGQEFFSRHHSGVQPLEITVIGSELALRWPEGQEAYIPLETLRRQCPCASCQGEQDVLGNVHKPPTRPYGPGSFTIQSARWVGGYGYQPQWADGHSTGIYSWEYLRRIADRQ